MCKLDGAWLMAREKSFWFPIPICGSVVSQLVVIRLRDGIILPQSAKGTTTHSQMLFFSHRPGSNSFLETALSVPFPTPAPSAMERHRGECFLTLPCSFTSIHGL